MRHGFAAWVFLFAFQAQADFGTYDEGFYRRSRLPKSPHSPALLTQAIEASVKLSSPGGLECSSAVISPDGYVITALHCVADCLKSKSLTRKTRNRYYGKLEILNQDPNIECATYELEEIGARGLKIVHTGRGLYYPEDSAVYGRIPPAELERVTEWEEDYAILKVDTAGDLDCVPLADSDPRAGDWVWSVGYPESAKRGPGLSSDGKSEYIRYGQVRAELNRKLLAEEVSAELVDYLIRRYSNEKLLLTNMDLQCGASGSLVMDSEGELVGLTVEGASEKSGFRDGTSIELRASAIRRSLQKRGIDTRAIFSCPSGS